MARESFKPITQDRSRFHDLPSSADDIPDEVIVNLDDKDPNNFIDIKVVDDTPEDDRGRPTTLGYSEADAEADPNDSKRVQKRINRLKLETQTERRAREAAERERDAAIQLAQSHAAEVAELRRLNHQGNATLIQSMQSAEEVKLQDAQRRYTQAHNDGDGAAMAAATSDISAAQSALTAIRVTARNPEPESVRQQAPVTQAPQMAPNVRDWVAEHSDWWQRDSTKTKRAMSIALEVEARGIQPSSPEYTREIDKGLRKVYPDHKSSGYAPDDDDDRRSSAPRRTNVVADGSRDGAGAYTPGKNEVSLTKSEVSLANRMRIPLQKYAEEKRKRLGREGDGA